MWFSFFTSFSGAREPQPSLWLPLVSLDLDPGLAWRASRLHSLEWCKHPLLLASAPGGNGPVPLAPLYYCMFLIHRYVCFVFNWSGIFLICTVYILSITLWRGKKPLKRKLTKEKTNSSKLTELKIGAKYWPSICMTAKLLLETQHHNYFISFLEKYACSSIAS